MIPFTPYIAHECLDLMKCKTTNTWPKLSKIDASNKIKLAIQINGKTRDVISINSDLSEDSIAKVVKSESKASKYLVEKNITKTIYVKNKVINYIIKN